MPFTSRGKEQEHNLISSFQLYCMRRRHFFFIFSGLELFYDSCCAKLNEMDFSMLPLCCKLFHRILTSHPFNFDTVGIFPFQLFKKKQHPMLVKKQTFFQSFKCQINMLRVFYKPAKTLFDLKISIFKCLLTGSI